MARKNPTPPGADPTANEDPAIREILSLAVSPYETANLLKYCSEIHDLSAHELIRILRWALYHARKGKAK